MTAEWTIDFTKRASKQYNELPENIRLRMLALLKDLRLKGYMQSSWPNFSPLNKQNMTYHCHIKKGKPTYVVCWQVISKNNKTIEVYYVGTHESAPY